MQLQSRMSWCTVPYHSSEASCHYYLKLCYESSYLLIGSSKLIVVHYKGTYLWYMNIAMMQHYQSDSKDESSSHFLDSPLSCFLVFENSHTQVWLCAPNALPKTHTKDDEVGIRNDDGGMIDKKFWYKTDLKGVRSNNWVSFYSKSRLNTTIR